MKAHFGTTNTGKPRITFSMTEDEYQYLQEDHGGACLACGEEAYGVEPDAVRYRCDSCDKLYVYGIEELLMMGRVEITGDDFDLLDIE